MRGRAAYAVALASAGVAVALLAAACGGAAGPTPSLAWQRIDPDPTLTTTPVAVVPWKGAFVGVGGAHAWRTSDGVSWTASALPGTGDVRAADVTATRDRLVAVGSVSQRAVVWTSTDGLEWTAVVDAPALGPVKGYAYTELDTTAAGAGGVVAAGTEWGDAGQRAVAWRSDDGLTWERASSDLAGSGARDLLAIDDGFVLAAADNALEGESVRAMFWTSPTGAWWTRATDIVSFGNGEPQALAARQGLIVAAGYRVALGGGLEPMAWTSFDGRTWEAAERTEAMGWWPFPGPTPVTGAGAIQGSGMTSVVATDDGFLAVGAHWGLDPAGPIGAQEMMIRSGLWSSKDGMTWRLVANDLVSVSHVTSGTLSAGVARAMDLGGHVLLAGSVPDAGGVLWLGGGPAGQ